MPPYVLRFYDYTLLYLVSSKALVKWPLPVVALRMTKPVLRLLG